MAHQLAVFCRGFSDPCPSLGGGPGCRLAEPSSGCVRGSCGTGQGRAGLGCARSRCLRPSRRSSRGHFALSSLSCRPFLPSLFPFPAFARPCVLCPGPAASRLPSSGPLSPSHLPGRGSGPAPPRGFLRSGGEEGSEAPRGPAGVAAAAGRAALRAAAPSPHPPCPVPPWLLPGLGIPRCTGERSGTRGAAPLPLPHLGPPTVSAGSGRATF